MRGSAVHVGGCCSNWANFCLIIVAQFRVVALLDHSCGLSNGDAELKHERTFSN